MNCQKCNSKILEDATFCNICGEKIKQKSEKNKQLTYPNILLGVLILLIIILSAYSIYAFSKNKRTVNELTVKIGALTKEKEADYFQKKVECKKYTDEIKNSLNQGIDYSKFMPSATDKLLFSITESFNFVFYSPKDNSCLYSTEKIRGNGDREFFVYNALTKSKITSFQFPKQFEDYKKFILEYSNGEIRL